MINTADSLAEQDDGIKATKELLIKVGKTLI